MIVPGDRDTVELQVGAGVSLLRAQQPGPFSAGTTAQLTLTPELLEGVTTAGKITLTATQSVSFGESKSCTPVQVAVRSPAKERFSPSQ